MSVANDFNPMLGDPMNHSFLESFKAIEEISFHLRSNIKLMDQIFQVTVGETAVILDRKFEH